VLAVSSRSTLLSSSRSHVIDSRSKANVSHIRPGRPPSLIAKNYVAFGTKVSFEQNCSHGIGILGHTFYGAPFLEADTTQGRQGTPR